MNLFIIFNRINIRSEAELWNLKPEDEDKIESVSISQ